MDQNYVAMGYIIEGMSILNDVENIATFNERPKRPLLIHDCGLLKNALWYLKNMSSLPILSFRFVPNFSRPFIIHILFCWRPHSVPGSRQFTNHKDWYHYYYRYMAYVYFVQIVVLKKNYLRALFDWKEMTKASLSLGTRSPNQIGSQIGPS